jgi:hypothetical protein
VARQKTVRGVRQRFAGAEHAAAIRWDQSVAIRNPHGCGEAGCPCGCREPGGDQFPPRIRVPLAADTASEHGSHAASESGQTHHHDVDDKK